MFRRILVTLDGSEFAEAALPAAAALARRSGGELRLLVVQDPGFAFATEIGWTIEVEDGGAAEAAGTYLEGRREVLAAQCPNVTTVVREGYPADEILREADAFDADLVVMATHGRGGFARLWVGSVANHVVRHAHRSVLMIRPNGGGRFEALREGSLALHHVFVPLDGSELAERALGTAIGFANLFGSRVTLVRLVPDLTVADREFFPETVARTEDIVAHEVALARAYLERVAYPIRTWGLKVDTYVVPSAEAASSILDRAAGQLIVMATHARTGLGRALMGSVTEGVVHAARGPVLVIPPEAAPPWTAEPTLEPRETLLPLAF